MANIKTLFQPKVADPLQEIRRIVSTSLSYTDGIFEHIMDQLLLRYGNQTTKAKGDLFEVLCREYLLTQKDVYDQVWILHDVPEAVRTQLKLGNQDIGIDLVAHKHTTGGYVAVQCKFRKRSASRGPVRLNIRSRHSAVASNGVNSLAPTRQIQIRPNVLPWNALSTFYGLCARSGPWDQHLVMTTCDSVTHKLTRTPKDKTMAYKSFCNISRSEWQMIAGNVGRRLGDTILTSVTTESEPNHAPLPIAADAAQHPQSMSQAALREKRLAFFEAAAIKARAPVLTSASIIMIENIE